METGTPQPVVVAVVSKRPAWVPKQLAVIGILGGCIIYLVVDLASGNGQVGTTKRFTPTIFTIMPTLRSIPP